MPRLSPTFGEGLPGMRNWLSRALVLGGMADGALMMAKHQEQRVPQPYEKALANAGIVVPAIPAAGEIAMAETLVDYGPFPRDPVTYV